MLNVRNLEAGYGKLRVLRGISLHVRAGEIVALIGANGAGKTTLLTTIAGVITPMAGEIAYDGSNTRGWRPERLVHRGCALVPEGRQVFGPMTVEENLLLGAHPLFRRRQRSAVATTLTEVYGLFPRLEERRRQLAGTLSGGEQQMLAIGRGLMSKPKLLILDELSQGLSPLITQEIFKILVALNKEGLTTLVVDQNLTQTLKTSDYGYVMENGRIVLEGTSQELLSNDKTRRAYLGM